jgi:integrase/recombinase XerD
MNLRALQRFLGHADISTTTIYLNLSTQDLHDEHAKASPVESLSKDKLKVG